jgi:Fe-S-cluster-containing dehydrogenase component
MLINIDRCVGCYACQVSCKAEYSIPFGTFRCKVETYSTGTYPKINKFFIPRLCNHCENAPCIESCEETALFKNDDGIVLLNKARLKNATFVTTTGLFKGFYQHVCRVVWARQLFSAI